MIAFSTHGGDAEDFSLTHLIEQSAGSLLADQLLKYKDEDEEKTKILWDNLASAILVSKRELRDAESIIDRVLKQDESNIYALRNKRLIAILRVDDQELMSVDFKLTEACRLHAPVLKAKIHYSYYLTMVGDPKIVPDMEESVKQFQQVIEDEHFCDLQTDDQLLCHWLFVKVLVRTGHSLTWDKSTLPMEKTASMAVSSLKQLQLSGTNSPFFKTQTRLWFAELLTKFHSKLINFQGSEELYSLMGYTELPSIKKAIDDALDNCSANDAKVLARICKMYAASLWHPCDPLEREELYLKLKQCGEASNAIKWNITAASALGMAITKRWQDSFIEKHLNTLTERIDRLKTYAKNTPQTPESYICYRAIRDCDENADDRRGLLEENKRILEQIIRSFQYVDVHRIALARTMFTLGEDFQVVEDMLSRIVNENHEWHTVCNALQLWGFCCQENGELPKAEKLYNQVLSMAGDKRFKPRVAAQEWQCIISERMQLSSLEEEARNDLMVKLSSIYTGMSWKQIPARPHVSNGISNRFHSQLLTNGNEDAVEAYNYAEYLALHKENLGTRRLIQIYLDTAASTETASWFFYAKIIHMCLRENQKMQSNSIDVLVCHSKEIKDAVTSFVTGLQMCSVRIVDTGELPEAHKQRPLWEKDHINQAKHVVIFLTDNYLRSDELHKLMPTKEEHQLISKVLILCSKQEQLRDVPEYIHTEIMSSSNFARTECCKLLALRLVNDFEKNVTAQVQCG